MTSNTTRLINSQYFEDLIQEPTWHWTKQELATLELLKNITSKKKTEENKQTKTN